MLLGNHIRRMVRQYINSSFRVFVLSQSTYYSAQNNRCIYYIVEITYDNFILPTPRIRDYYCFIVKYKQVLITQFHLDTKQEL